MSTDKPAVTADADRVGEGRRTIAIANQKGGSAKTTTTVSLAACLAELGKRILVVDTDPQCNTTHWFGFYEPKRSLYNVFQGDQELKAIIRKTQFEGIWVAPASRMLAQVEWALAQGQKKRDTNRILRRAVSGVGEGEFDFVLFDCPPRIDILCLNALIASEECLIPVALDNLALDGLGDMLGRFVDGEWEPGSIDDIQEEFNPQLRVLGILPCRYEERTLVARDVLSQIREVEHLRGLLLPVRIREYVRLRDCFGSGMPITQFDPKGKGAEDYRSLARHIVEGGRTNGN